MMRHDQPYGMKGYIRVVCLRLQLFDLTANKNVTNSFIQK